MNDGGNNRDDVAARLVLLRQWAGFTSQAAYAERVGMSQSEYNHFESGRRPLTLAAANKLRLKWRVTLDWLYHGDRTGLSVELNRSLPSLEASSGRKGAG